MVSLPGVRWVRKDFWKEDPFGEDSPNEYAAVVKIHHGWEWGADRRVPFREEGELSRKDENLYGQPLGRWRELDRWARTTSVETNVVGWQLGHYPEDTEEPGTLKGFPVGQPQIRLVMQDGPCSRLECGSDGGQESVERQSMAGFRQGCDVWSKAWGRWAWGAEVVETYLTPHLVQGRLLRGGEAFEFGVK